MRPLLISLILAGASLAAECGVCQGTRVVGAVPLFYPCAECHGTGTTADPPPAPAVAAVTRNPGQPRPAVCRVVCGVGQSLEVGTGVLVRASGTTGLVLTAWHVVRGNFEAVDVSFPDGSTTRARVVAWDQDWDLAALFVGRPEGDPVEIAIQAPRLGDPLTIAGYGPAGVYREQTGRVTDYGSPTRKHAAQFVELEGTARSGDSGGPIFTADGQLAGVLFGTARKRTIGSCSTRLALFLAEADRKVPSATCSVCEVKP